MREWNQELADRLAEELEWPELADQESYTCKDCPDNKKCYYVWDAYNVNGDCLASK